MLRTLALLSILATPAFAGNLAEPLMEGTVVPFAEDEFVRCDPDSGNPYRVVRKDLQDMLCRDDGKDNRPRPKPRPEPPTECTQLNWEPNTRLAIITTEKPEKQCI